MSKTLKIVGANERVQIFLDGQEVDDVISYKLEERLDELPKITLEVAITGPHEVQR